MNRRNFTKGLLAAPVFLPSLSSAALAALFSPLADVAGVPDKRDPTLESEVDDLLRRERFIDTAASDRFHRYPSEAPLAYDPDAILPFTGGALLGIGQLTEQIPIRDNDPRVPGRPGQVAIRAVLDGPSNVVEILQEFECLYRWAEAHADKVGIARTSRDMIDLRRAGKLALVPGLDSGNETGGDPLVLAQLYRLGLRKMAMVHEAPTPFSGSDSSEPRTTPGLNPLGREMVAECNRLGIMVDISHSSDPTFWGVMECARRPVIATHSGMRGKAFMARNLTDEMLQALAKNGGMVGIGAMTNRKAYERLIATGYYHCQLAIDKWLIEKYPNPHDLAVAWRSPAKLAEAQKALGFPKVLPGTEIIPTLMEPESTLAHLDYAIGLVGFDHVGIGTDLVMDSAPYPGMIRGIARGLIKRRYTEEQIRKIMSANVLRVLRDNEGSA